MSDDPDLEKRLAALEKGGSRSATARPRRSPLLAVAVVLGVGAGGAALYMLSGSYAWAATLWSITLATAICFALGVRTRTATII